MRAIPFEKYNEPSPESLSWVEAVTGDKVDTEKIRKLPGGTSSLVFEIPFLKGAAHPSLILRLFHKKEWLALEPDLAKHEGESLRTAAESVMPSPELMAFDETGESCGMPAVLMTKLPGETILQPADMESWLDQMAEALAKIHQLETKSFSYEYFSYNDALKLDKPLWSNFQEEWMRAFFIVAGVRPQVTYSFLHRDYHPANILWENDEITGIVDWVNACRGPAGIDVGHCRVNLVQLYGLSAADLFLEAYRKHAGKNFHYDPYWDLLSLTNTLEGPPKVYAGWTALGLKGLSDELVRYRLDEFLLALLKRFDN